MVESFENAGTAYLVEILRAAIDSGVGHSDPEAGWVVAALMVALVMRGAADRVGHHLQLPNDGPSIYEVTCFDAEDRLISHIGNLDVGQAIPTAVELAGARPGATLMVSIQNDEGYRRCVLLAKGSMISFQFPEGRRFDEDRLRSYEEATPIEETSQPEDAELPGSIPATDTQDPTVLLSSIVPPVGEIAEAVIDRLVGRPLSDE